MFFKVNKAICSIVTGPFFCFSLYAAEQSADQQDQLSREELYMRMKALQAEVSDVRLDMRILQQKQHPSLFAVRSIKDLATWTWHNKGAILLTSCCVTCACFCSKLRNEYRQAYAQIRAGQAQSESNQAVMLQGINELRAFHMPERAALSFETIQQNIEAYGSTVREIVSCICGSTFHAGQSIIRLFL